MELNEQTGVISSRISTSRDLERAPQPQDAVREKIAQGYADELAGCCYQY